MGFNTLGLIRQRQGRIEESRALRERSLALALEHELTADALRAYNNVADIPLQQERFREALDYAQRGLALAEAQGDRRWGSALKLMIATAHVALGDWDQVQTEAIPGLGDLVERAMLPLHARIYAGRGQLPELEQLVAELGDLDETTNWEYAAVSTVAKAIALRALGDDQGALAAARPVALGGSEIVGEDRRDAYVEAGLAALALGDDATVERLIQFVSDLPPAQRSPSLRAGAARFAGLLAARRGDLVAAGEHLDGAIATTRQTEVRFLLGQVLVERAEALAAAGQDDQVGPLLDEAAAIFQRLGATPWLERTRAARAEVAA